MMLTHKQKQKQSSTPLDAKLGKRLGVDPTVDEVLAANAELGERLGALYRTLEVLHRLRPFSERLDDPESVVALKDLSYSDVCALVRRALEGELVSLSRYLAVVAWYGSGFLTDAGTPPSGLRAKIVTKLGLIPYGKPLLYADVLFKYLHRNSYGMNKELEHDKPVDISPQVPEVSACGPALPGHRVPTARAGGAVPVPRMSEGSGDTDQAGPPPSKAPGDGPT